MMEYRNARPDERDDFMDLARLAFGFDLEKLIPKVYDAGDPSPYHKVAVDERGRIRSQVAVLPQTLWVAGQPLRVGFVGLVSTHPRERGQGHMKALMDLWMREAAGRFDLLVLYGQRQRYEHHGFTLGGVRVRHTVDEANVRHALATIDAASLLFHPFADTQDSRRFAHRLHEKRMAFVERDEAAFSKILNGFGQKAWSVSDQGRSLGYLVTNSEGTEITEVNLADSTDLKRVVKGYLEFSSRPTVTILMPDYEVAENRTLAQFAERTWSEPADMYRIVDFAPFLEAFLKLKNAAQGLVPGVFSAVFDGQPVTAVVDKTGVSVTRRALAGAPALDRQQAQSLLLSPHGHLDTMAAPSGWFPLPVFWYYADRF